ncbi:MAG TPA: sigma-70 family RNA polymerase sigma factor, partial [Actinophytocola sp.]|uniref:sigma-70 family RNA polymerase sigma factor n=1 Tax=Actinophytocola sp. TaxID=1872138 RepID=UPI002DDCA4D4
MAEAAVEWRNDLASDAVLISAVRDGDVAAYGVLYERHVAAARRAASGLVATRVEREDLVAEAFTRVLRVLRQGHGPVDGFRPYLLTTMRNAVITSARRGPAVSLFADVPDPRSPGGREDPMSSRVHSVVVADAFASLPERWRVVLWHTEIEGETPARIAARLGMTANGVAALAYRAREGLRQAYLQQHLPELDREDCRAIADQLAGWIRRGFPARKMRRINDHLDRCDRCRELADGLGELNGELRGVLAPILLGAPFALAYLSAPASSGTALATSAGAGVSTVSWLTAVKTVVAGAAIVTTAAVGSVASDP